jgi:hypothetical protein
MQGTEPTFAETAAVGRPRWRFNAWKAPLILLLIIIGFYWKLTLTRQFDWVWGPDLTQQVLPWFEEESRQVHQQQFPLWDPHTWVGQPLVGQAQPGAVYPLNWILFAMPRSHGHISMVWLRWYFIVIHYLAALFCYLLCRDLGRSRAASLIAGLVFSLGGYLGTAWWPQMANGAVWSPLVFLFLVRTVRGVRPWASGALCGLSLGMAWLSGHHQVPTYLTLACCGVWVYHMLGAGAPRRRLAGIAALALVTAGLVGALQLVPASEYAYLARRWAGAAEALAWNQRIPYYVHARYSLSPLALFGIIFPGMGGYADPFIGVTAFTLAVVAAAACWGQRAVRLFTALGLAGLLYALGQFNVFQGLIYALVPTVEKARAPSVAVVVFNCAAAVLAAFAIDLFVTSRASAWLRRTARAAVIFGAGGLALILAVLFLQKMAWGMEDRLAMAPVAALLLGALLYGWRRGALAHRQFVVLLAGLVVLELGTVSAFLLADRNDAERRSFLDKVTSNADIAGYLDTLPKPFRIDTEGEDLALAWAAYHNFSSLKAFTPSITRNLAGLEFHKRETRQLFNVRYTVARKPPAGDFRELFTAASGLKVYEDPGAFPRAWTVHELVRISHPNQGLELIGNRLEDLRNKAFLSGEPPRLDSCAAADQVTFVRYRASEAILRAQMSCRGMLVLSDTFYPGWRASIDGRAAPIHEVNSGMRGVVVPAGSHEVRFYFRPLSVYLGAALSVLGVLLVLLIARAPRRRPEGAGEPSSEAAAA